MNCQIRSVIAQRTIITKMSSNQKQNTNNTKSSEKQESDTEKSKREEKEHHDFINDIILPHVALILIPIIASINTVLSRATFTIYDESIGQEALNPITLIVCRTIISFSIFIFIKKMGWFGSKVIEVDSEEYDHHLQQLEKEKNTNNNNKQKNTIISHNKSRLDRELEECDSKENNNNNDKTKEVEEGNNDENNNNDNENDDENLRQKEDKKDVETNKTNNDDDNASTVENHTNATNSTVIIHQIAGEHADDPLKSSATFVDVFSLILVAVLGTTINYMLFFNGVSLTNGLTVSGFMSLVPATTFIWGLFLGTDKFSWLKIFMTAFIFLGNCFLSQLWLLFDGSHKQHNDNNLLANNSSISSANISADTTYNTSYYIGVLCMFFATCSFSGYLVLQKPLVPKFNYVDLMIIIQGSCLITILFVSLVPRASIVTSQILGNKLAPLAYIGILFSGIVQGSLNWFLMSYAVASCKSVVFAACVMNSAPLFVALESILFLGETMNDSEQIGIVIIVLGVILAVYVSVTENMKDDEEAEKEKKKDS